MHARLTVPAAWVSGGKPNLGSDFTRCRQLATSGNCTAVAELVNRQSAFNMRKYLKNLLTQANGSKKDRKKVNESSMS